MKFGCAFFGWLAATGMSVVLLAILAGIGAVIANARGATASDVSADPASAGIVGAIVALVVLAVAYFCGGYVAGWSPWSSPSWVASRACASTARWTRPGSAADRRSGWSCPTR